MRIGCDPIGVVLARSNWKAVLEGEFFDDFYG